MLTTGLILDASLEIEKGTLVCAQGVSVSVHAVRCRVMPEDVPASQRACVQDCVHVGCGAPLRSMVVVVVVVCARVCGSGSVRVGVGGSGQSSACVAVVLGVGVDRVEGGYVCPGDRCTRYL